MSDSRPDLYDVLGVSPEATRADISRAYRALLRRHHPDTWAGADDPPADRSAAALQQVQSAYDVLGDPQRRAEYDRQRPCPSVATPVRRTAPRRDPRDERAIVAGPIRWRPTVHSGVPPARS